MTPYRDRLNAGEFAPEEEPVKTTSKARRVRETPTVPTPEPAPAPDPAPDDDDED